MSIRWGHFSDLHFKFENFETNLLRDSLLSSLEESKIELKYIFITGDILHKGEYDERTEDFIKKLAKAVNCDLKNVIICPGNHDVERNSVRKLILNNIIKRVENNKGQFEFLKAEKPVVIDSVFNPFYNICKKITSNEQQEQLHYVINCGDLNIYVLNTAVFAGQTCPEDNPSAEDLKKEDTCLYICDNQLYNLRNMKREKKCNDKSLNVVIGHHGMECFSPSEKNNFKNLLDSLNVDLYLCGHVHSNALDRLSGTRYTIPQVSCGGLFNDDYNEPSFIIGEFDSVDSVKLINYSYIKKNDKWSISNSVPKPYDNGIYPYTIERLKELNMPHEKIVQKEIKPTQQEFPLKLQGYTLLSGRGTEGIKYYWKKDEDIVESITFNKRLKTDETNVNIDKVSAYTTSISIGCVLNANATQCKFCETGTIGFKGYLTAEEIALQNIFMADYDSDCPSFRNVRDNRREFAYMGQGEPGHAYHLIRKSILLTDCAMEIINQKVERYIISTSGITGFIPLLINDIKNGVFKNKVTVHFSLNMIGNDRDLLMPINKDYDYSEFIKECRDLYECSNQDKIGVGILIFKDFVLSSDNSKKYTLTEEILKSILDKLDSKIFKIDLCDYNQTSLGEQIQVSNEYANKLLEVVKEKGFEGKLFSSFGTDKESGCGMLKSSIKNFGKPGETTKMHYENAVDLLKKAKEKLGF